MCTASCLDALNYELSLSEYLWQITGRFRSLGYCEETLRLFTHLSYLDLAYHIRSQKYYARSK